MTKTTIFKNGSTTFFYSSLFFPNHVREDVFTLYAYVRTIDDIVDCSQPDLEQLEELWLLTKKAWKGSSVSNPVVSEFIDLARRREFEWEWIQSFWWAMRQDLVKKTYRSFAELEKYMYGSAEVIGLMMCRILSLSKEAETAARLQGKAMQLINFIRDVKEDEELGRLYLGEGVDSTNQLRSNWDSVVKKQLGRYHRIQAAAEKGYQYIPYRYLIPIRTAAELYSWTARRIHNNPTLAWSKKMKPSKVRVIATVIKNSILVAL